MAAQPITPHDVEIAAGRTAAFHVAAAAAGNCVPDPSDGSGGHPGPPSIKEAGKPEARRGQRNFDFAPIERLKGEAMHPDAEWRLITQRHMNQRAVPADFVDLVQYAISFM